MSLDTPPPLPARYLERIAAEAINELPIRRYEGPIHVVAGVPDLASALQDLRSAGVVGFDTETRPAFRPGESYPPSLVQLASANAVYLLQLKQQDFSEAVRQVLSDASLVKVGVSVSHDVRELQKLFPFDPRAVLDLGTVASRHGVRQTGVRSLAALFLGIRIPKGAKTTNWAMPRLTAQQVAYAATDAWVCRELYLRFAELAMV